MTEILELEFMRHALVAGLLASVACGVIGAYVVLNRVVFISAGIAHAAYGGIGLGYFLGFNPVVGALGFSLAAALGMGVVERRTRQRTDTLIGALWAIGMAVGIILVDLTQGYKADLMSYLFGSILAVPTRDLWLMAGLDVLLLLVVGLCYKELLALSFDEDFAKVRNVPVHGLYLLLLCLIALTVVMLMRVVGLILVIALLTLPAAISALFLHDLRKVMAGAIGLGACFATLGLLLSYWADLTSGATIILVAAAGYLVALAWKAARDRRAGRALR